MRIKIRNLLIIVLLLAAATVNIKAQDIEVIAPVSFIFDTVGSEMIFDFEVVNISNQVQTIFEVRTLNDLPPNWQSSLCFGQNCFAPQIDSVATTQTFNTPPLNPGDTLITSLHVFAFANDGTAEVKIDVGTFMNPDVRTTLDFTATTNPTAVDDESITPKEYFLNQNYPNPFNPSTIIKYGLKDAGFVTLKLYDVLGNEVAGLVNGYKLAGSYQQNFDASRLSSGIYFYKLTVNNFTETKKMILEK